MNILCSNVFTDSRMSFDHLFFLLNRYRTMKVAIYLCFLALYLIKSCSAVRCVGRAVKNKRGESGTEMVSEEKVFDHTVLPSWSDCYSECRTLCQGNEGGWDGCMSFDVHAVFFRGSGTKKSLRCNCYGFREEEPTLVDADTNFQHFKCSPSI